MNQNKRRPTLADVAERSGMSKTAVSLVLNDRPGSRLSEDAAERIRLAAIELGYKPNPAAQSLRLGKTKTIGFISDEVTITRYASGMIRGVLSATKKLGYTTLISETAHHMEELTSAIEAMLDRNVDGILIGLMSARLIDISVDLHGTPLVIVNGQTSNNIPSVLPDELNAGRAVAANLVAHGHRDIAIIGELPFIAADPRLSVTIARRFQGIDETFENAGIAPVRVKLEDWNPDIGYKSTIEVFAKHPEITAVLAGNDNAAFGVYQALSELGKRIPEDVSVISFDDDEIAEYLRPGLTTCRLPYEQMATLGAHMILGRAELEHQLMPMVLVNRGSVTSINSSARRIS